MAEFNIYAHKKTRVLKKCPECPKCPATKPCTCSSHEEPKKSWDPDAAGGLGGLAGAAVGFCLGGPLGALIGFFAAGSAAEAAAKS